MRGTKLMTASSKICDSNDKMMVKIFIKISKSLYEITEGDKANSIFKDARKKLMFDLSAKMKNEVLRMIYKEIEKTV